MIRQGGSVFAYFLLLVGALSVASCATVVLAEEEGFAAVTTSATTAVNTTGQESNWRHEFTTESPMHPIQAEMKAYVEGMLEHAINGYLTYAFPADELESLSGTGREGMGGIYVTLIDSLDMLALMGRPVLFRKLAKWVENNVTFDKDVTVSGFETNIRLLGGLLGAHFMYEEGIVPVVPQEHDYSGGLLQLAVDLGNRLLRAFNTPSGIPYGSLNLRYGVARDETPFSATASGGTYLLEFVALSRVTGDSRYEAAARRASQAVYDLRSRDTDLVGNHINVGTGSWSMPWASVGSGTDSAIEYWLKGHSLSGESAEWDSFARVSRAVSTYLREGGFYLQKFYDNPSLVVPTAYHCSLASFYPGCLAHAGRVREATEAVWSAHGLFRHFGAMAEQFQLSDLEAPAHTAYPLRPEHLESIYHLYRATGDPAYLKMGKEFAIALNLRTHSPYGFTELRPVTFPHSRASQVNRMESFMISETLKYLYLLFDECNPVHMPYRRHRGGPLANRACAQDEEVYQRTNSRESLVGWEFTTEAHLFPNHAEWFQPAPASAESRPIPPGLIGPQSSIAEVPVQGQVTTLLGQAAARLRTIAQMEEDDPSAVMPAPNELRWAALHGDDTRAAPLLRSPEQARVRAVLGIAEALMYELQPTREDREAPRASLWSGVSTKHQYYCQNHPVTGLDRLSKSVYREMAPPRDY